MISEKRSSRIDPGTYKKKYAPTDYKQDRMKYWKQRLQGIPGSNQIFGGQPVHFESDSHTVVMDNEGVSLNNINFSYSLRHFQAFLLNIGHLLDGLLLLNQNRIVHGDIKLANVVMNEETGVCKYIDYDYMGTFDEYTDADNRNLIFPDLPKSSTQYDYVRPLEMYINNDTKRFDNLSISQTVKDLWKTSFNIPWADIDNMEMFVNPGKIRQDLQKESEQFRKLSLVSHPDSTRKMYQNSYQVGEF